MLFSASFVTIWQVAPLNALSRLALYSCYVAYNRLTTHCIHVGIRQTSCIKETRVLKLKTNVTTKGPLNPWLAGGMLPVTQIYCARGDIWNEEMSCNAFPAKTEIERRTVLKTWVLYLRRHALHVLLIYRNLLKIEFLQFLYYYQYIFVSNDVWKNKQVKYYI